MSGPISDRQQPIMVCQDGALEGYTISRIVFFPTAEIKKHYPKARGCVNLRGGVHPIYKNADGDFFLEQTDKPVKGAPLTREWGSD